MRFPRLTRNAWAYGFFNTWGVVGVALVVVGASGHEQAILSAGLIFLSAALIDVAILFPIVRARRDLRRRSPRRRC
jgi:hypothetical protein